jgi:hypothetical protein
MYNQTIMIRKILIIIHPVPNIQASNNCVLTKSPRNGIQGDKHSLFLLGILRLVGVFKQKGIEESIPHVFMN